MLNLALLFVVLFTLGSGASTGRSPDSRIIGGGDAVIETFPYQVSVQKNGKHNCGGTILSQSYVLTASHCFASGKDNEFSVRAGVSFREQGGSMHRIDKIVRSENTKMPGKLAGDVALVHLVEPIKFDATRQPIGLFSSADKVKDDQPAVITGWGRTTPKGEFSKQLKTVTVPIVSQKVCKKVYGSLLKDGEICAGYYGKGGKDACQGDSGGPMIVAGKLAGVVSWGKDCAQAKFPGVYAEIAYHREWIKKYAGV